MITWLLQFFIIVYCEPVVESCSAEKFVYLNARKDLKNINPENVCALQNRYCIN